MPFQILVHHGNDANGEITGNPATDLKKSYPFASGILTVPVREPDHVFDAALHRGGLYLPLDHIRGKNIAHRAVLPAWNDDGQVPFGRGDHPAMLGVDLVILLH